MITKVARVILVEGVSDRAALVALAERQGRRLEAEGISIVAMGGAMNLGRFLAELERMIAEQGESVAFRTFQNQPHQRGRPIEQQLHRFIGTLGGRKELYARAFIEHLDPDAVPRPIELVLAPR